MPPIFYSLNIFSIIFEYLCFFLNQIYMQIEVHMVYMFGLSIPYAKVCLPRINKYFSIFLVKQMKK